MFSIGVSTNTFGFSDCYELTHASMGNDSYGYSYDSIGNRKSSSEGALTQFYLTNELNQYLSITNTPLLQEPTFLYDRDGNLTNDSQRVFYWDGENRLIAVEDLPETSSPRIKLSFSYDSQGRRIKKQVSEWGTLLATWMPVEMITFIYDGSNMISETSKDFSTMQSTKRYFAWGVGSGLLAQITLGPTTTNCYFSVGDANGNITDYVDASGGVVAHYDFDPYGNMRSETSLVVDKFRFCFASGYLDQETGLYLRGNNYYSPRMGRCIKRNSPDLGAVRVRLVYPPVRGKVLAAADKAGRVFIPYQSQSYSGGVVGGGGGGGGGDECITLEEALWDAYGNSDDVADMSNLISDFVAVSEFQGMLDSGGSLGNLMKSLVNTATQLEIKGLAQQNQGSDASVERGIKVLKMTAWGKTKIGQAAIEKLEQMHDEERIEIKNGELFGKKNSGKYIPDDERTPENEEKILIYRPVGNAFELGLFENILAHEAIHALDQANGTGDQDGYDLYDEKDAYKQGDLVQSEIIGSFVSHISGKVLEGYKKKMKAYNRKHFEDTFKDVGCYLEGVSSFPFGI